MSRFVILFATFVTLATTGAAEPARPLKALLVAGGCCHDYAGQHLILANGIQARALVQVDVVWTDDKSVTPPLPLYDHPDWAKGYDIVLHDECAAGMKDPAVLKRILDVHQTVPAVHLHCAMHSFRTGSDAWFRHLGLQSNSHGPQEPIAITFVDRDHPITQPLADWTTIKEELYNNVQLFDAHPLAMGRQKVKQKDGSVKEVDAIVAWTNEKAGARSFSTSLGHNSDTVADARYLDLVTRGLLWACGKLEPAYLQPFTAAGKITFVKAKPVETPKPPPVPKNALGVKATASSEETGKNNFAWRAVDGDETTRWCAANASYPQWLQLELDKPQTLTDLETVWENNGVYQFKIEVSRDGQAWSTLVDGSANAQNAPYRHSLAQPVEGIRYVKIHALGKKSGGWASLREVKLQGPGLPAVAPKLSEAQKKEQAKANDPYAKEGNIPPRIDRLTPEQEAAILKDVKVAEGFEVSLFANSAAANYPVFVAAAPDGTLYVSSDGNGSLGRNPKRGRVIRLRDLDGDGRADETKVFCEIDSPRGLVWDRDRLYLVHPPHLSEFIDADGDGVAEKQNVLVKDIAFGFKDRPADHTTNGLSLGIDGWLYIAGGDFGFLKATGTDGRTLQHRGGGVIRVRPDGTGLEIYSTGTRNILEVAISPLMDLFARDNTNDGGGWNVRFHHFTGLDDHGYPRLYKNFNDECIQPLADYGGGSGCGAVYIDEPGFGTWNNAPFTADWGTGALWHHQVKPRGATFEETRKPEPFIRMTRPTDADVDALSRVYCASWKGATFNWEGPDVGYIVQVKPKGFQPEPLPDFAKLDEKALLSLLDLSLPQSYRRRIEAQRELQRRGSELAGFYKRQLEGHRNAERNLAASLLGKASDEAVIAAIAHTDPVIVHTAVRAAAKRKLHQPLFVELEGANTDRTGLLRALAMIHTPEVVTGLIERLGHATDPALRQGILAALCRLHFTEGEWKGDSWGTRPDTRGPYYQPEAWSETPRIAAALKQALAKASPEEAAFLVKTMNRNRIQSNDALARILALAKQDAQVVPEAVAQLAVAETIPADAVPLLVQVVREAASQSSATLAQAIVALTKTDSAEGVAATLAALEPLKKMPEAFKDFETASTAFYNAPKLENHHQWVEQIAEKLDGPASMHADAALLHLAARTSGSPESRELTRKALDAGWNNLKRRKQILDAIGAAKHMPNAAKVLVALDDADPQVKAAAERTAKTLRLQKVEDKTPKIATLPPEEALKAVITAKGDLALGEQVFTRATCVACHTVRESEAQKGPYLGNIAQTYKRPELAQNILDPNKTIAQGFASELITLKDGSQQMGFITLEGASEVKLRNIAAQEFTFKTAEIQTRQKLPTSMMPPGLMLNFTVREFASLLDYLEALAKK